MATDCTKSFFISSFGNIFSQSIKKFHIFVKSPYSSRFRVLNYSVVGSNKQGKFYFPFASQVPLLIKLRFRPVFALKLLTEIGS